MPEEKQKLIKDEDRSTEGGPQHGLAFMIILGSAVLIGVIVLVFVLST